MKGVYLETLSWPEAETLFSEQPTVVLPIGARCKEHGHHLPLNTDWLQAEYYARAIAQRLPVVVLPTLQYGHYPAFVEYPGSINLKQETFQALILDICHSLSAHGIGKFYALNMGISTLPALEHARAELQKTSIQFRYCDPSTLIRGLEKNMEEQPMGGHADELETSCLLSMHPDTVHMHLATTELNKPEGKGPFRRKKGKNGLYSPSGIRGDATLASKEKGDLLVAATLEALLEDILSLESSV